MCVSSLRVFSSATHRPEINDEQFLRLVSKQWADHCRQMVRKRGRGREREGEGEGEGKGEGEEEGEGEGNREEGLTVLRMERKERNIRTCKCMS